MQGIVFQEKGAPVQLETVERPAVQEGQVVVDLKAAALNHRDVWITKGMYPGIQPGVVLGSDGAGEANGQKVIINPSV